MASTRELIVKFLGDTKDLAEAVKKTDGSLGKLKAAAVAVGGAYAATKVVDFLGDATKAAEEDRKSQALLATQIKDTTSATDDQIAGVEKFINKLSRATGVADDDLRPAYAGLVRATGDVGKAQDEMATAMNIAAGRGVDLQSVVSALEKAHNGNTGALGRMGLATKDAAGNALSLDQIMQNASKTYAGAAEAAVTPSQRWKVATEELKESIGDKLLPVIGKLEEIGAGILSWFDQLDPKWQLAIEVAVGFGAAVAALIVVLPVLTAAVSALGIVFAVLTSPITLVVVGIAALAAGLIYAYTHCQTFRDIVDTVIKDVQGIITGFISTVQSAWQTWGDTIVGVWNVLAGTIKTQVAIVLAVVQPIVDLLHGDWGKAWDDFKERVGQAWAGIVQSIQGAVTAIAGLFDILFKAAEQVVGKIVKAFADMPGKILDALPGPLRTAVEAGGWITGVTPLSKAGSFLHDKLPGIASGGTIAESGAAIVHKGETVIPAGGMAGGITISGPVSIYPANLNEDEVVRAFNNWARRNGGVRTPGGVVAV